MLVKEILRTIPQAIRTIRCLFTGTLSSNITLQHLRVLVLVKEGMGITKIADTLHVSLAAVSKVGHALVEKNLIKRLPGKDKRSFILKLTTKGERTLSLVTSQVEKTLEHGLRNLSEKEKQDLMTGLLVLEKLMNHLSEV